MAGTASSCRCSTYFFTPENATLLLDQNFSAIANQNHMDCKLQSSFLPIFGLIYNSAQYLRFNIVIDNNYK